MSQLTSFKLSIFDHKHSYFKIISNFLSGVIGIGIGLVIGSYLGWL